MGGDSWLQFRGPGGDGVVAGQSVTTLFGEDSNVKWKTAVPGRGWSSPIVVDGLVWVTTAVEQMASDEERLEMLDERGVDAKKQDQSSIAKAVSLKLIAIELDSGRSVKSIDLATINHADSIHSLNSYASPTPVAASGKLFCHFGTYGTFCVDRKSGGVDWKRQLTLEHGVGPGSSPLVHGDHLILIQDGIDRQYVTTLDVKTGETIWETDRPPMDTTNGDMMKAYCTPMVTTDRLGRLQYICLGAQWMVAYEPKSGDEIWKVKHGRGFSIVARPVIENEIVYFSTGFGKSELFAVKIDGAGDVSDSHVLWTAKSGIPKKPSPVLKNDLIYVIADNGVARCIRSEDGSTVWKERLGGDYSASPILVNDNLFFFSQGGKVTVMKTGEEVEVVAVNQIDGKIMASPAVVDGAMILRTDQAVYRIEE